MVNVACFYFQFYFSKLVSLIILVLCGDFPRRVITRPCMFLYNVCFDTGSSAAQRALFRNVKK